MRASMRGAAARRCSTLMLCAAAACGDTTGPTPRTLDVELAVGGDVGRFQAAALVPQPGGLYVTGAVPTGDACYTMVAAAERTGTQIALTIRSTQTPATCEPGWVFTAFVAELRLPRGRYEIVVWREEWSRTGIALSRGVMASALLDIP